MEKSVGNNIEKFHKLATEKQVRILNAAMKEFQYGYKKATTDVIVKEAGISKGLLFHYFGKKEYLFSYLLEFTSNLLKSNLASKLLLVKQDIIAAIHLYATEKRKLRIDFPYVYDFISGVHAHWEDALGIDALTVFEEAMYKEYDEFYNLCDESLFRPKIDTKKAIDIMLFTVDTLLELEAGEGKEEIFSTELEAYVKTFYLAFYKK